MKECCVVLYKILHIFVLIVLKINIVPNVIILFTTFDIKAAKFQKY